MATIRLAFFTEARFVQVNNAYYALDSSFSMRLFERYLQYFDSIVICARVRAGTQDEVIEANRIFGERVEVYALPYYLGFNQFVKQYFRFRSAVKQCIQKLDAGNTAFLCRVPGRVGATAIGFLRKCEIPYGIEVVGDPYDVFSNGAVKHWLSPVIRQFAYHALQKIAWHAPLALYVTETKLQERYPNNHFSVGVSDVDLRDEAFTTEERLRLKASTPYQLICVGTLEQMYKAPDIMLKAFSIVSKQGHNMRLTWVGDGIFKHEMMELAKKLSIDSRVNFAGKLPSGEAVRKYLDEADLFVMPSRMEGLPRAMVEAMARGLPCIGTKVCGIQELLDEDMLVPINDEHALAEKIIELSKNEQLSNKQRMRNLKKSLNYHQKVLAPKRTAFYNRLRDMADPSTSKKSM